jgi:hypothetical protein
VEMDSTKAVKPAGTRAREGTYPAAPDGRVSAAVSATTARVSAAVHLGCTYGTFLSGMNLR